MATTTIDRRVARTRAMLHEALLSLIAEKRYETITVEEICERANTARSTFYAHYTDKDDLMRCGFKTLRETILGRHNAVSARGHPENPGVAFSLAMFEHARDHAHLHRTLVGSRGGSIALDSVRRVLCEVVRAEFAAHGRRFSKDGLPREGVVQFVVGACMAVVTWWLEGGAKLSPSQIDAMFQRLVTKGIPHLGGSKQPCC